jgi:hypothetical protein
MNKPNKKSSHADWRAWLKLHGTKAGDAGPLAAAVLAKLNRETAAVPRRRPVALVRCGADSFAAAQAAADGNRRITNWEPAEPVARRVTPGEYRDHDAGRYSSRSAYHKIEHRPIYASWAVVGVGGVGACYRWGATNCRTLKAPAGMTFKVDGLGLVLVRESDGMDYHVTAEDLRARDFAGRVRKAMAAAFTARREAKRLAIQQEREAAIRARELATVRVTLADSRAAGNCVEGSLRFAETRLGIQRHEILAGAHLFSVAAGKLLQADGKDARVAAAINRAWARETAVQI